MEIGFFKTRATLGLLRQHQPHRGQTGTRLLSFLVDADTDDLNESIGLLVKLGGGQQIELVLRGFCLGQSFPQQDNGGFPLDGYIGRLVCGRGLGH